MRIFDNNMQIGYNFNYNDYEKDGLLTTMLEMLQKQDAPV